MQIVIDIPKDEYKEIYNGQFDTGGYFKANLRDAFRHGTPLPKGHGRLIDADVLFDEYEKTGWFDNADRDGIAEKILLNAPTIIEADKEDND